MRISSRASRTVSKGFWLASAALVACSPLAAQDVAETPAAEVSPIAPDELEQGFENPGEAARPRVWWHWMNGNITIDGIEKDMAWMKRVGIAGLQAFDAGLSTPQVVEERLPYMSEGWKDAFRVAAENAARLDLELGIAASPGWSETGGPWVTGPDAMKKMVWSVTEVTGGERFRGRLASPPRTTGIFQTSEAGWALGGREESQHPPELYEDQKVIAFRVPAGSALPVPKVTVSGGEVDAGALADGDLEDAAIGLPAGPGIGGRSWIQFDYGRQVTVRGMTLATPASARVLKGLDELSYGAPPVEFVLEVSDDGVDWRDTGAQVVPGLPQRTISVDNARGRYFRFVSLRQPPTPPQPLPRFSRGAAPPPEVLQINELSLRGEPTVHSFETKAAFFTNSDYYALPSGTSGAQAADPGDVVDLTARMRSDGTLDWNAPAGDWRVLRIGYSLTGAMNRPASPEATGLEVDKLDPAAVRRYMDHYLGMYREASGGLMGEQGLQALMFDSWEASHQNWTPGILEEFAALRGYDPVPWLPAMAGYVVGSAEQSDAFLWDWRRTVQQLLQRNHYEVLTEMLHDRDLIRYGEGHEAVYATMADGMEMKQSADIPMAAMWQVNVPGEIEGVYFNDIQESASVAHIYGQNLVATEALTGGPRFGSAPWDLKTTADAILLAGANRFVIHTSTHQPVDKGPGMTLGPGQYFTRNETWAEQAGAWIDYLSRSSYLLQQGRGANDIAVFYGEAGPVVATYRNEFPEVPEGYRYDYVNGSVIREMLSVEGGKLVTETGMQYGALLLGGDSERISLPVLRRLHELVRGGATVVGKRPHGSPSLADDAEEVAAIIDTLWPDGGDGVARVGEGRVFARGRMDEALAAIGLAPDMRYDKPHRDSKVMFLRRRLDDGDLYFLANRTDRRETVPMSFRVSGKRPELWDPATGERSDVGYRIVDGRTEVTVDFDPFGTTFLVFREPALASSHDAPAARWSVVDTLSGPWNVAFQSDRGAPASIVLPELIDFRDSEEFGIRYFSGVASYTKQFRLDAADLSDGRQVWLDLGQVYDLAEVWVNGELAGTVWKPPYRLNIAGQARAGDNTVEIRAVNLWVNRLIGDVQPGVSEKVTFTSADGVADPDTTDERALRRLQMPYPADAPLRPSGLIGPVRVVTKELVAP